MTVINYPRHFAYLALGASVLFTALRLHFSLAGLALNGTLHAAAMVLALRGSAAWLRSTVFVASAAALSYFVLYTAVFVPAAAYHYIGYCVASAFGAALYWYLVRGFWLPDLTIASLLRTVGLCAAVTLVWQTSTRSSLSLINPWNLTVHTLCWWLAFSFSLYLSERAGTTPKQALLSDPPRAG